MMSANDDNSSIIAMNNRGAREIACDDFHSAIEHLSHALHSSRTCARNPLDNFNQATFDISVLMEEGYNAMKAAMEAEELVPSLQRITPSDFIYSSPISVPDSAFLVPGLRTEVAISSIVIFNLALSHHLLAIQTKLLNPKQHTTALLAKSMKLYELAIQLQQQDAAISSANCSKLFILSLLNNLGNIYRLLGNEVASQYCFQQLLSLLLYLNYHDGFSKISDTSNYSTFFKNVLRQHMDTAPAA